MKTSILGAAVVAVLLAGPAFAEADVGLKVDMDASAKLALGAGLDYWLDHGMVTSGYLFAVSPKSPDGVRAGLRSGISVNHNASLMALPFDGFVRFEQQGAYVDALLGPHWLTRDRDFRVHAALGVGAKFDRLSIGLEAGWLNPSPIMGGRFAFAF